MLDSEQRPLDYHGRFRHGIDGSRRLMIPAKWRPTDKSLVLRAILWPMSVNDYILVLPPCQWRERILDKIKTNRLSDERAAVLERVIGETSAPLELDKVGRFCLPDNLADPAGLEKEAVLVGRVDKFEIWSSKRFDATHSYNAGLAAEYAKEIGI
jgi:MraZ protein